MNEGEETYSEHADHLCCYDPTCPCHEDPTNIATIEQSRQDGLITTNEADMIYRGRVV